MAKYRKVDNCGPVPYPDRSGKFLNAGEVAEGDDWEPLVSLGFVVKVDEQSVEQVTTVASAAVTPKAEPPLPKSPDPKADILKEEAQGVTDVQTNDGAGAEEMDSSETGKSGDEGVSGRSSSRRRR